MPLANNRALTRPPARFATAGGSIFTFRHPFLYGQISGDPNDCTVDVTNSLKLNDTFFNTQNQIPSAVMEPTVGGGSLTVTNTFMGGTATLNLVPGSGLVCDGDLIAIATLIIATGDDIGGMLLRRKFVGGKSINRLYYGVAFANVPPDILVGNGVPTVPVTMLYSGFIDGVTAANEGTLRKIWAVGAHTGYTGTYKPAKVDTKSMAEEDDTAVAAPTGLAGPGGMILEETDVDDFKVANTHGDASSEIVKIESGASSGLKNNSTDATNLASAINAPTE